MKKSILLIALWLIHSMALTQTRLIKGQVFNEKGESIAFASISVKGTSSGTTTDPMGNFKINVRDTNSILIISSIGYRSVEIFIGSKNNFVATLYAADHTLQEVVVTGIGFTRKRSLTGYSVSRISASEISSPGLKTWKRSGIDENSVQLSVGYKDNLPLKSVQVAVQVDGFRARVLFDYFFYSDNPKQLRGDFKLKLPVGASPYYFAFGGIEFMNTEKAASPIPFITYPANDKIDLGKDTIRKQRRNIREAIVSPKEKASYAYGEVIRGRIDPALMEWAGADVFSCSVFPITRGKLHHIVVGYDVNLLEAGPNAVFQLALPYGRIPKKLDIDIANNDFLEVLLEPVLKNKISTAGRIRYHLENFAEKNIAISIKTSTPIILQNTGTEKYFALSYQPALHETADPTATGKAVFLLDLSLSSQPDKFNVWLKTIEGILNNNRKDIRSFNVLCFNVTTFWWKDYYMPNTAFAVGEFLEYADKLNLAGATDLGLALREAASPRWMKEKDKGAKTLFLMSDGDASWGEQNLHRLSNSIAADDKVFAFTTGLSGTDTRILDHLARQSDGAVFSVLNEDEVEKVARGVRYKSWRIKSITLDNGADLLIAGRPYNVFAGQTLMITGRGQVSEESMVKLVLQQGKEEKTFIIPAKGIIKSDLSRRIYGQVAVNQLEEFSFLSETEAIKYSSHFDVAGKNCSWVMLESQALYSQFGLTPIAIKGFIDTSHVNSIIYRILSHEQLDHTLGSNKQDFKAWIEKMKTDKMLRMRPDTLFDYYFSSLPETSFDVAISTLNDAVIYTDGLYKSTVQQLEQSELDYDNLMNTIQREKKIEGKATAFKLLTSFAENNRHDITLLRELAFTLNEWNLESKAYELLKQLMLSRPTEPATYNLIANNLIKMGYLDLAIIYYDIAFLTDWDARFDGFDMITAIEYYKLLKNITTKHHKVSNYRFVTRRLGDIKKFLEKRNIETDEADLIIVLTWNTDNTDVDLHVREPNGALCSYQNYKTINGGILTNDARDGFGPETYIIKKAPPGKYQLDIDYYSSNRVQTSAPSKILVTAYTNWGRSNEEKIQKVVTLKESRKLSDDEDTLLENVLVMEF